jgi:hypothetical protein
MSELTGRELAIFDSESEVLSHCNLLRLNLLTLVLTRLVSEVNEFTELCGRKMVAELSKKLDHVIEKLTLASHALS